jgi:hypothetical protein
MSEKDFDYITDRVDDQISYFDKNAIENQKRYRFLKSTAIVCNVLTTMTIALAFTVPEKFKVLMGIIALILSTIVLATYQWEEFQNYGGKWEKFRLVAEQLKSEKYLFLTNSGRYLLNDQEEKLKLFATTVENILQRIALLAKLAGCQNLGFCPCFA